MKLVIASIRGQFDEAFKEKYGIIADASRAGIMQTAAKLKKNARAAIGGGGFGIRWQNALRVDVHPKRKKLTASGAIYLYHKIPYAGVFETGATIRGKPLMWLPTTSAAKRWGRGVGGGRLTPQNFSRGVATLRSTRGTSTPMLVANVEVGRKHKRTKSMVIFVGVPLVKIGQKFSIARAVELARRDLAENYFNNLQV